jgi:uncharacterized membrane protein
MKKRNLFMSTTIMCVLLTGAFTFKNNRFVWFWENNIPVAMMLGVVAVCLALQWRKYRKA